jgi:hypothetical protein
MSTVSQVLPMLLVSSTVPGNDVLDFVLPPALERHDLEDRAFLRITFR